MFFCDFYSQKNAYTNSNPALHSYTTRLLFLVSDDSCRTFKSADTSQNIMSDRKTATLFLDIKLSEKVVGIEKSAAAF